MLRVILNVLWLLLGGLVLALGWLLAAVVMYAYNMLRTWMGSGRPSSIASDHFLLATLFLLLVVPTGILVAINFLWEPSGVPFGRLHLVGYTHLALTGFILQTIFGAARGVDEKTMALQYLEALKSLAASNSTTWIVPMELSELSRPIGDAMRAARITSESEGGGPATSG